MKCFCSCKLMRPSIEVAKTSMDSTETSRFFLEFLPLASTNFHRLPVASASLHMLASATIIFKPHLRGGGRAAHPIVQGTCSNSFLIEDSYHPINHSIPLAEHSCLQTNPRRPLLCQGRAAMGLSDSYRIVSVVSLPCKIYFFTYP